LPLLDPLGKEALSNHRCTQEVRQPGKKVGTLVPEMMFELVGGAFVGLSIPTILFGLGMIGHLSPFIEAFVETKHTAPTMADCWKTVPNVVAGKCLEQINKSGIWRQKKCCRVDSPAMGPKPT